MMTDAEQLRYPLLALLLAGVVVVYGIAFPLTSGDMHHWLVPWYDHIVDAGPLDAFSAPFANYTPPYLYFLAGMTLFDGMLPAIALIKILAIGGAVALAASVGHLLRVLGASRPAEGALWVLLLPPVVLNAPLFGQCDAFWSAACVMAVSEAIKRRAAHMLFWCGAAVAFKAQAVFLAPFILALLIARRTPVHLWLIPPAIYVAAMLPAWSLGWPATDLATIHLRQSQWEPDFIGNASNPWSIVAYFDAGGGADYIWAGLVAAGLAAGLYIWTMARRLLSGADLLWAALLSAAMLPWLLPKMHERFFFLADILAFALAYTLRTRASIAVALLIQSASILAFYGFLGWKEAPLIGCLAVGAALLIIIGRLRGQDREAPPTAATGERAFSTTAALPG